MANDFKTTQYVLDEVFVRFINYLMFAKTANRNLEGDFKNLKYATGQTINYRLEERYSGGEGATASAEDRVQVIRPLTIEKQFHNLVQYGTFDLTFDRAKDQPYLDMWLNPAAKRMANQVEGFIGNKLKDETYYAVGSPASPITFPTITAARALMTQVGIPDDYSRYCSVNPDDSASLTNSLFNVFNNRVNTGALISGFIGHLASYDFFETNFLGFHQSGVPITVPVAGTIAGTTSAGILDGLLVDGASTIALSGLTASVGTFKKGDVIQLAPNAVSGNGYYSINPLTYESTGKAAQFVVTADITATGAGEVALPISPVIALTGSRQNIVSQSAAGTEAVNLYESHNVSVAYHNQAIIFAAPPIAELRGGVDASTTYSDLYKMSMTYSQGADVTNYQQLDRLDVLAGCTINPEFAVRIMSQP